MLIGGVILAAVGADLPLWEHKEDVLAVEETLTVPPSEIKKLVDEGIHAIEESKDFVLNVNASVAADNKFHFYIGDSWGYWNIIYGQPFAAYYFKENLTSTSFSLPLTRKQVTSYTIYFVVENPLKDVTETVTLSATLEWNEKPIIATATGGIVVGGMIAFLGIFLIIIAWVFALVFKPKATAPTPPTPPTQFLTGKAGHSRIIHNLTVRVL